MIQRTKIKVRKIWAACRYEISHRSVKFQIDYTTKSLQAYLKNGSKNFQENLCVYIPRLELSPLEMWGQTE